MKDKKFIVYHGMLPFQLNILVQLQKPFLAKVWNYHKYTDKLIINVFPIQLEFNRNRWNRWYNYRTAECPRYKTVKYLLTGRPSGARCTGYCPICD